MEKVAVYCRVSTEEQKEKHSIDNQVDFAKEFCKRNEYFTYDYYLDNGISGSIPFEDRPEGRRLLEDAREGKFKNILIWKIDRLGRDTKNSLVTAHLLKELDVGIKSMTEPFDTSTPVGEFMFTQLASMAKLERDNIRERSIIGTNRIARQGKWLGGIVPYGYYVDKDRYLVVNENNLPNLNYSEADVIRMIYDWIGKDGLSTLKIVKKLNALNIPPHYTKDNRKFKKPAQNIKPLEIYQVDKGKRKVNTSGSWHAARIGNIARNTTYMGIHFYGKRSKKPRELIERKVSAIVTPELWHKTQETLKNNFHWAKRNTKREYLLRGLIRCGLCGRNLHGTYKKPTARYRCNSKLMHNIITTGKTCESKSVNATWLENLVWNDIKEWILNPVSLESIIKDKLNKYEKEKENYFIKLRNHKSELDKKEQERSNILGLYRKDLITMSDVEQQLQEVDKDKAELNSMINDIKAKMVGNYSSNDIIKGIKLHLDIFRENVEDEHITFEYKRKIIELLVKDVIINLINDNKHSVLIDTIPFRDGIDINKINKKKKNVETVYLRFSDGEHVAKTQEFQSDTINICYKFPLPNKEIGSIVQHTGKDS